MPRLPPLPVSFPPSTEPQSDPDVNGDEPEPIAPHDINLDVHDRNIMTGKRQRTMSARAAGAVEARRPTKRVPHTR